MEKNSIPLFNNLYMARTKKTKELPNTPSPLDVTGMEPATDGAPDVTEPSSEEKAPKEELEKQEGQKTELPQEEEEGGEEEEEPPVTSPIVKVIPRHVGDVLKVYPKYQNLYVDDKGGTYTEDTIEAIRGEAELYKNPYYIAKP